MASQKHPICTHFPEDQKCEICKRTKSTRDPRRGELGIQYLEQRSLVIRLQRTGEALPRAEKFGGLITAAHEVLNEGCESRDTHRYAVVVQDLATQWIQSFPCKTKTSYETERSLSKFLQPSHKPKVIYTDNALGFGNMSRSSMESPHFNTSSIRDKWHR